MADHTHISMVLTGDMSIKGARRTTFTANCAAGLLSLKTCSCRFACVSVCHMCAECLRRLEKDGGTGVTDDCKPTRVQGTKSGSSAR